MNDGWNLDSARTLTDDELLGRMAELGFHLDKRELADKVGDYPSAEALYEEMASALPARPQGNDEDFAWMALTVLWERWFPDVYNLEMLDDSMQHGYRLISPHSLLSDRGLKACVDEWEFTWEVVKDLATRFEVRSVNVFDDRFPCTRNVFKWSQDFADELLKAEYQGMSFMRCSQFNAEFNHVFPETPGCQEILAKRVISTPVGGVPKRRKIGRNEPCPCGSGKKYKRCCGQ